MKPKKPSSEQPPEPPRNEVESLLALYNARRYAEAESRTRALLNKYPEFGFGWKLLGGAQQMQGKDALPAFRKVAELMPADPEAHFNLGVVLKGAGRLDEAADRYRTAIALNPDFAEAHSNLGNIQQELGQFGDAVTSYRRAIKIKPDSAIAYNNLGTAFRDQGDLEAALASYRKAIQLNPAYTEAYCNLGNVLKDLGHLDSAVENCRKALELNPDYAEAHSNLGNILKDIGQFDSALASFRQALAIDPKCDKAILGESQLFMINGEMGLAEEKIEKVLELSADNLEARLLLAQVRKTRTADENLSALIKVEEAVRNNLLVLPYHKAVALHFSLGKSFDDLGDYDRAFPHFIEGCKLKRATLEYDAANMTRQFNETIRVFDGDTIERLRGGGNLSDLPIFVLGMPRSGTTLVEQIIASHPDVHGAGELLDMQSIAQREVSGTMGFPGNILNLDGDTLSKWGDDYVAGLHRRAPDARHITDKMPNNFWFIGLIHVMLPNAKIIHVRRNPVDTCLSCFTKLFSGALNQTYDLSELGRYYVDYLRLMEHWRKVLPAGAFLDVQYEDVVADQETEARRIIDFCGLDWNDACIDFYKNKRSVGTASVTQVRRPIYKSSVERWRHYEKFLGPLLDTLGDLAPK
jgi:tetratricopeptide (TPR) repeat protein